MKVTTVLLFAFLLHGILSESGRVRRHLVFNEKSQFFLAVDVRDNLFEHSDFFAGVFGVKMSWNLPDRVICSSNQGRLHRRHIHQGIEQLLEQYGFNGRSCVQKFICEALRILPQSDHFLAQLYEIVFAPKNEEKPGKGTEKECQKVLEECPVSLLSSQTSAM